MVWVSLLYMRSDLSAQPRTDVIRWTFNELAVEDGYRIGGRGKLLALRLGNFCDVVFEERKVGPLLNGLTKLFSPRYLSNPRMKAPEHLKSFDAFDSKFKTLHGTKYDWGSLKGPELQPLRPLPVPVEESPTLRMLRLRGYWP